MTEQVRRHAQIHPHRPPLLPTSERRIHLAHNQSPAAMEDHGPVRLLFPMDMELRHHTTAAAAMEGHSLF